MTHTSQPFKNAQKHNLAARAHTNADNPGTLRTHISLYSLHRVFCSWVPLAEILQWSGTRKGEQTHKARRWRQSIMATFETQGSLQNIVLASENISII